MQRLPGTLSISYPHGGDRDYVSIRLRDDASGVTFAEVEVSYEEFTRALSSMAERPCVIETRGCEKIGKTMEIKHVTYDLPAGMYEKGKIRAALATLTKPDSEDGWRPEIESALSTQQPHGRARVAFRRWV